MAEFSEVMRQVQRMCDYRLKRGLKCNDCDAAHICMLKIRHAGLDTLCADADAVMAWAAEHPVVYPTWLEWLKSLGVIPYMMSMVVKPIPADSAEKLGIEPKGEV